MPRRTPPNPIVEEANTFSLGLHQDHQKIGPFLPDFKSHVETACRLRRIRYGWEHSKLTLFFRVEKEADLRKVVFRAVERALKVIPGLQPEHLAYLNFEIFSRSGGLPYPRDMFPVRGSPDGGGLLHGARSSLAFLGRTDVGGTKLRFHVETHDFPFGLKPTVAAFLDGTEAFMKLAERYQRLHPRIADDESLIDEAGNAYALSSKVLVLQPWEAAMRYAKEAAKSAA